MPSSPPSRGTIALAAIGLAFGWVIVFVPALLLWAWRAVQPPWLLPLVLSGLLGIVVVGVLRARQILPVAARVFWRLRWVGAAAAAVLLVGARTHHRGPTAPSPTKRVAVVGAGAAGVHATWMLQRQGVDVTLYEASSYVGGHAYAYPFELDDGSTFAVDMGFLFGAPSSYQAVKALLALHGVERSQTALSLSAAVDGGLFATGVAERDPEVGRFVALAEAAYEDASLDTVPFWAWLRWHGFSESFRRTRLTPLMSFLFITETGRYEVSTRFALNMLVGPRRWLAFDEGAAAWTVRGGSSLYYERLSAGMGDLLRLDTPVVALERGADGVLLRAVGPDGPLEELYDDVILSVPADVARVLLTDRSPYESFVLGQVRYSDVEVVVHTDQSTLPDPPLRRPYHYSLAPDEPEAAFELTSMASRAVGHHTPLSPEPMVTLNPQREYEGVRMRRTWRHNSQDLWHLANVLKLLPSMQGRGGIWYAGDWVKFFGHGMAAKTGIRAACQIGGLEPVPGLATTPCVDVRLVDPAPYPGIVEDHRTICGEADAFRLLTEMVCGDLDGQTMVSR